MNNLVAEPVEVERSIARLFVTGDVAEVQIFKGDGFGSGYFGDLLRMGWRTMRVVGKRHPCHREPRHRRRVRPIVSAADSRGVPRGTQVSAFPQRPKQRRHGGSQGAAIR